MICLTPPSIHRLYNMITGLDSSAFNMINLAAFIMRTFLNDIVYGLIMEDQGFIKFKKLICCLNSENSEKFNL